MKLKQMEDWENKVLYEQAFPKAGEMFNFLVFDDLRNKAAINHDMYLRNAGKTNIGAEFVASKLLTQHLHWPYTGGLRCCQPKCTSVSCNADQKNKNIATT